MPFVDPTDARNAHDDHLANAVGKRDDGCLVRLTLLLPEALERGARAALDVQVAVVERRGPAVNSSVVCPDSPHRSSIDKGKGLVACPGGEARTPSCRLLERDVLSASASLGFLRGFDRADHATLLIKETHGRRAVGAEGHRGAECTGLVVHVEP